MRGLALCLLALGPTFACSANGHGPSTQVASAATESETEPAALEPGAGGALRPEMVASYFQEGALADAARRFALEDWEGARAGFAAAAVDESLDDGLRARAGLMASVCAAELERFGEAATGFEAAIVALPALSDWLRYQAARAHYFAGDHDAARRHAESVAADSIAGADAALLIGDVLRGAGDAEAVAAHYRGYLDGEHRIRRTEARFRLGEALESLGRLEEAAEHYRRISVGTPLSGWAAQADARLQALLPKLPAATRTRMTTFTAADYIERGMEYFAAMRNEKSEADFAAALSAPGLDEKQKCVAAYHLAQSVYKQRNRTRSAPLFDAAYDVCRATGNADLAVKSAYNAGRSYDKMDEAETAIERFSRVERFYPEHTYADDARLRQAEQYEEIGEDAKVDELLASSPKKYPDGDMRAQAYWRLAWRAYKAKNYQQALRWLDEQIRAMPIDDYWGRAGQAQYWKARSYGHLGKTDQAIEAYREAIFLYPLSYYSLLALNRLRESHPEAFAKTVAEMKTPPADPREGAFDFRPRPVYESEDFGRALEFLRLGLAGPAQAELARLGFRLPPHRDRLEDPDEIDRTWAMAFLFDAAGRYTKSHWVTRWNVLDYQRHWPEGAWRAKWDIAYPRGWWNLLERHAGMHGYPTELLISFVREESAFDPLRESFANAIGLTQMIFPTARRFARGTGIVVSREALRDPEKNVTIGSRFLAFLVKKWDGRIGLVVPSYNAGAGAVTRWVGERGTWAQDEFAEEIPYDETRRYNKRVTASYFAYSYLKDYTIPLMPN